MNEPTFAVFKNVSYAIAFIQSLQWLGLNPQAITIFTGLMIIDVVTGVIRSSCVTGGSSVKSKTLTRGVLAKMLVLTALFSVALAGKGVGFDMNGLVQAAVSVLILGELYSILGNIHSVRTGKHKVEFDAVSFLLCQVKKLLQKTIK